VKSTSADNGGAVLKGAAMDRVFWVYSGNYGKSEPRGIQLLRYDAGKPSLTAVGLAAPTENPNFVVIHPKGGYLYAVTPMKVGGAAYGGAVEAYAIDGKSGKLTLLNRKASEGANPAHVAMDRSGRLAIIANYGGGTVAAFRVGDDGRLGEATATVQHQGSSVNPKRQAEPHPHGTTFDPSGEYILVPDLGLDKLLRYRVDVAAGTLTAAGAAVVPAGSGPRHVVFGADGRFMYVINELTCTLSVIPYDAAGGEMRDIQTIAVWPEKEGASGAEIEVHPNGRLLYASNRGVDSIAVCEIDGGTGKLRLVGTCPTGGRTPRHFGLDPTSRYILASNMDSNSIDLLQVDASAGGLAPANVRVSTEAPCCVAFIAGI
jgi:6-phosphogluconolactonase